MASKKPDLRDIPSMPKEALGAHWAKLTRKPVPKVRSRRLLAYALAWELQARREGGLCGPTRRRLADALKQGAEHRSGGAQHAAPRPQSCLVRRWRGRDYEVVVLPKGYLYAGRTYRSLSQIAREITGTRWNGPAFFGLRRKPREVKSAA